MEPQNHDRMQAWVSLIHAATYFRAGLERAFREALGFSLAEQDLIKQLHVNGGALTLSELGKRIYFSKAGVTRMLDRLEDAGLVARQSMPGDRRALSAVLTPRGEAAFAQSRRILRAYVSDVFGPGFADEDVRILKNTLEKLLRAHDLYEGQQRHLRGETGKAS